MTNERGAHAIAKLLAQTGTSSQIDLLAGMLKGLEGRHSLSLPPDWPGTYATLRESEHDEIRRPAARLALIFGDPTALAQLRRTVANPRAQTTTRSNALKSLIQKKIPSLPSLLFALLADHNLQREAIRGLASFNDDATPERLLASYPSASVAARTDILQTLASRKSWAARLIDALEDDTIPRRDVSSYTARQIVSLNDAPLRTRIEKAWGKLNDTAADKRKQIDSSRKKLSQKALAKADPKAGHELFKIACAVCHRLHADGAAIGPDLTGAQRNNLDYLLENIIDPSASVASDYQMQIFELAGGRTISGFVIEQNDAAFTVRTLNEQIIVPRADVMKTTRTTKSVMPDGLLQAMSTDQFRNLIAYLMSN
jgi:putative heme-binding domain-containing protein